jgi:hypothetical protein
VGIRTRIYGEIGGWVEIFGLKCRLVLEISIWGTLKPCGDGCFSNVAGLKSAIHQPFLDATWRKIKPSLNLDLLTLSPNFSPLFLSHMACAFRSRQGVKLLKNVYIF